MNENALNELTTQRISLSLIEGMVKLLPSSRYCSLSLTALEKGRMYIGEVCMQLGKEYPYEKTKKATKASEIQAAADVSKKEVTISENEIVALNDIRAVLNTQIELLKEVIFNENSPVTVSKKDPVGVFEMNCVTSEAYRGLKEARMWLGKRLGEIRDESN